MEKVLFEERAGDLWITLNFPERRNALGSELLRGLNRGLCHRLRAGNAYSHIVFDHAGPVFCAGADLQEMRNAAEDPEPVKTLMEEFSFLLTFAATSPTPTVAVVGGAAVGGGVGLAMSCQYLLAMPGASCRLPEISLGLFPSMISGALLRRLGVDLFVELLLAPDGFDRQTLITRGVADGAPSSPYELARDIAGRGPRPGGVAPLALGAADFEAVGETLRDRGVEPDLRAMTLKALRINAEMSLPLANMTGAVELAALLQHRAGDIRAKGVRR